MKPIKTGWKVWPPVVIVRYWIVQGTLYMNWAERIHRWSLELLVFLLLYELFASFGVDHTAVVAFVVTHTFSAVFNGHVFAMLTHDLFWYGAYKEKPKFLAYLDEMQARISHKRHGCVAGVVFFGSLARGVFRTSSDLDVRFIAKDGFWNALCTAHVVFMERLRAFFAGFPIDAYMFMSEDEIRRKMDVDNEHPVSMYHSGDKLYRVLPETVGYDSFRSIFAGKD